MALAGQLDGRAILALVDADAHLVLCAPDKRPCASAWQDEANRPTAEQTVAHTAAGGLVGVIPGSVGLVVVDVDTDGAGSDVPASMIHRRGLVEQAIGEPLATVPTPSGGGHMLYKAPAGDVGNLKWTYGDVRGTRGYCVIWQADRWLAAISAAPAAEPVNVAILPSSGRTPTDGASGPAAVAAAPAGQRNSTLNREAFKSAAEAARNGRPFDTAAYVEAARAAGLPDKEAVTTVASAAAGGVTKADTPAPRAPAPAMRKLLADDDDTDTPAVIVPGLLWDGCVSVLSAAPKAGKSSLVAHGIGAAYTAAPFLGDQCGGDARRPLCIWSEMQLGMLRAWMRRHVDNPETLIYADRMRSVDQILEQVELLRPQAVVVDSLTALAAADGSHADLWRATDVRRLIEGVRAAGSAALIVHHVRKGDGQIRDSSDIAAAADMLVEFDAGSRSGAAPDPDVTRRRLSYRGRWDEPTRWIDFDRDTGRYREVNEPIGGSGGDLVPGTAESRLDADVSEYLMNREQSGAAVRELARVLHRRPQALRASLSRVATCGPDGRWRSGSGVRPETSPPTVGTHRTQCVPEVRPTRVPVDGTHRDALRPEVRPGAYQPYRGAPRPGRTGRDAPGTHPGPWDDWPDGVMDADRLSERIRLAEQCGATLHAADPFMPAGAYALQIRQLLADPQARPGALVRLGPTYSPPADVWDWPLPAALAVLDVRVLPRERNN